MPHADPEKSREYHRARYLAYGQDKFKNREKVHWRVAPRNLDDIYRLFTTQVGECMVWTRSVGHHAMRYNYATVWWSGRVHSGHRLFYEHFVGAIPEGHHLHHVCENTKCVNPAHMLPVLPKGHAQLSAHVRKTHCPHGHEYTPENIKPHRQVLKNGKIATGRACRECHRIAGRKKAAHQNPPPSP